MNSSTSSCFVSLSDLRAFSVIPVVEIILGFQGVQKKAEDARSLLAIVQTFGYNPQYAAGRRDGGHT